MRIWSLKPSYLDWKGLGAQWREALLAQKVVQGKTKGWRTHPQLIRFQEHSSPLKAVGYYLLEIFKESVERNYKYNYSKIICPEKDVKKVELTLGQLEYEFNLLQNRLKKRTPSKYLLNSRIGTIEAHPLFRLIDGPPELWERSYWKNYAK
jgi:hypothetical protein